MTYAKLCILVFVLVLKVYAHMYLFSLHVYHELDKTLSRISNAKYYMVAAVG